MPGRVDPSRDLRLGLHALESGAIGREELIAAVREWAGSTDRTMTEILAGVDAATLARLESRVATDLACLGREAAETVDHVGEADSADTEPGEGGRFRTLRHHARGGLGEVFVAFDRELNRTVALKELQARLADDPGSRARFLLEAEVTGGLEHPGIVSVYSLGRHPDGRPYYAMRMIRGETLQDAIARFHAPGGSADLRDGRAVAFHPGCSGASSTPVTPSPTPIAAGSFTATSSLKISCSARSARPWSSTGASPRSSIGHPPRTSPKPRPGRRPTPR